MRHLVVHDMGQLDDVEPARGNVGGDEHFDVAGLEIRQRARARTLRLVAVNGRAAQPVLLQLLGQPVRAMLGSREHQRLGPAAFAHQMAQHCAFLRRLAVVHRMFDELGGRVARRDFDRERVAQERLRKRTNLVRERRREQQVLPRFRQHRENAADITDESHVEHAIGFVEHEHLDAREIHGTLARMIQKPAWCGDDDVDATRQGIDLRARADAAEDQRDAQRLVSAEIDERLMDLRCKLAGRHQDQCAWCAPNRRCAVRARRRILQTLQ